MRSLLVSAATLSLLAIVACIDEPQLSPLEGRSKGAPAARPADPAHPNMAFVPGIAVDVPDASRLLKAKGRDKDKDKDAGTPPPPPDTEPAPTHIDVVGFWIDVTEVTVDSFRTCVSSGACTAPAAGRGCTMAARLGSHPVNCVSIDQARSYCRAQHKRLVTNDEWTAAAAGSTLRLYPWGDEAPAEARLNACGSECASPGMYAGSDGHVRTAPAGAFPLGRTPDGVEDLAGNVSEWVEGAGPIVRGASFEDSDVARARSLGARLANAPSTTIGFRCAADE